MSNPSAKDVRVSPFQCKKLSKNGEKLKNLRKEPSESKKEKIKQRREDKKNGEFIQKPITSQKDTPPEVDLILPEEDFKSYQKRMKRIYINYQAELNPVVSAFGKLPPVQVSKIITMSNGGLLFNFLVVDFSSRDGRDKKYITIGDLLSLQKSLQDENTKMFLKGPNRLLIRDLWNNREKLNSSLTRFMLVNKSWCSKIEQFMKQFNGKNHIGITETSFYNQTRKYCQCVKCQNLISDSDARINHVMNTLRNDEKYYSTCPECAGFKIYRNETIPADNYAACSYCSNLFYVAFDYHGVSARCPECRCGFQGLWG